MGFGTLQLGLVLNAMRRGAALASAVTHYFLLKEDGSRLLLEDGGRIIL